VPDDKRSGGTGPAATQTGKPAASGGASGAANASGSGSGDSGVDYAAKYNEAEKARKATEKELTQARAAIEQHARAQNSEVENMKADFEQLEGKAAAFEDFKYTTFLELAIMKDTRYAWYDVEDVRGAINLDDVEIDDDGKIKGLEDALKDVADRKPHLLRPADGQQQQGTPMSVIPPTHDGPSGGHPAGSPGGNAEFDVAALKKKYKIA
jgi:3-oxoacyl-ACP reductase-like protein